jgi:hypothetical protein
VKRIQVIVYCDDERATKESVDKLVDTARSTLSPHLVIVDKKAVEEILKEEVPLD